MMKSFSSVKANLARKVSMRSILAFLAIIFISIPVITIVGRVNFSYSSNWEHFSRYILPDATANTLILVVFTLLASGIIGVLLAVVVTLFDFPMKRFFEWVLYIPIAIPPYIAAYVYAGMLGYTGIVQRLPRNLEMPLPKFLLELTNIMNIRGAVFIYTITLYPYIYGVVKSFLQNHSGGFIDISRTLGYRPAGIFLKVILPLIRIPLIGGLMLVMMETISDYGVVKYFNIRTISSAIFSSWFGMGETSVAIRLSFYIMVFVIAIQAIEEIIRGKRRYNTGAGRSRPITPIRLKGCGKYVVVFLLAAFIAVAFVIPAAQMVAWAIPAYEKVRLANLGGIIANTLMYSTLAALIILVLNVIIVHTRRWMGGKIGFIMGKLTQLGYSIPGAVIAVGTITAFVALDRFLYPLYSFFNQDAKKLVLSTSIAMLVFAFVVRYMAIGFNSVNSAFAKVGVKYNEAARTLGMGRTKAMLKIELPMLKNSLTTGFILTFIDIIKELPLTLLLRPFNFNTLASRAYEYANDERIHEASVPALIIIIVCVLAVSMFQRIKSR